LRFYACRPQSRVGAIGLGVGTLATYARPGHCYRIYEINPDVIDMAQRHFTFLKESRGKVELILGDARLSLEQEPPQGYDVLVLDAFSGDAVPSHLLTKEVFEIYLKHLAPGGTIAVHITNTYLDLAPVVRAVAEVYDLKRVRIETESDRQHQIYRADWMLLSRNEELLEAMRPYAVAGEELATEKVLWTDDRNDLLQLLK
jgi:spermidine synthase